MGGRGTGRDTQFAEFGWFFLSRDPPLIQAGTLVGQRRQGGRTAARAKRLRVLKVGREERGVHFTTSDQKGEPERRTLLGSWCAQPSSSAGSGKGLAASRGPWGHLAGGRPPSPSSLLLTRAPVEPTRADGAAARPSLQRPPDLRESAPRGRADPPASSARSAGGPTRLAPALPDLRRTPHGPRAPAARPATQAEPRSRPWPPADRCPRSPPRGPRPRAQTSFAATPLSPTGPRDAWSRLQATLPPARAPGGLLRAPGRGSSGRSAASPEPAAQSGTAP